MRKRIHAAAIGRYACDDTCLGAILDAAGNAGLDGVLVHSRDVCFAADRLRGQALTVLAAISYPSGAMSVEGRMDEMRGALEAGADGLCIVAPMQAFRDGQADLVDRILAGAVAAADGRPLYAMVEACLLDDGDLARMLSLFGADFIGIMPTTAFEGAAVQADPERELARIARTDARAAWHGPAGGAPADTETSFLSSPDGGGLGGLEAFGKAVS